ncbi:MAG: hypothetical protein R3E95_21325 [Thiolinea sp.]
MPDLSVKQPVLLTCSRKLSRYEYLPMLLSGEVQYVAPQTTESEGEAVLAWGYKPSARKAQRLAERLALPLLRLEDGFIHSLGQGVLGAASWSLVVDHTGIYYDATAPSDLETLLAQDPQGLLNDPVLLQRAERLIAAITTIRSPNITMHLWILLILICPPGAR